MSDQTKDAKPSEILPEFMRTSIQRAIDDDKASTGMRLNDGNIRVPLPYGVLERALMLAERADELQLIVDTTMEAMSPVDIGVLVCEQALSEIDLGLLKRALAYHRPTIVACDISQQQVEYIAAAGLVKREEHDEVLQLLEALAGALGIAWPRGMMLERVREFAQVKKLIRRPPEPS